jgi:hypothetical protein
MSATTPALRGGIGSQRLGAALIAVALAIVALVAIAGVMSVANRTTTAAPVAAPAPASLHDRGWATDSGKLSTPAFTVPGDHGLATDGSATAPATELGGYWDQISVSGSTKAAPVVLPRALDPYHADNPAGAKTYLPLPRVFDPYHNDVVIPVEPGHHGVGGPLRRTNNEAPTNGGRGTRMEQ